METTPVGSCVAQVIATDADSGDNGRITYSLVSGNVDTAFSIDPDMGLVFLQKPLDVRIQPEYLLVVKASDSGEEPQSSFCNLRIVVVVPDYVPPKFERSSFSVDVSEATKVNHVVYGGFNIFSRQTLNYQLEAAPQVLETFKIDFYSGEVSLLRPLDYEKVTKYDMTIKVTNLAGLSDHASLQVNVLDANDNSPFFNKTKYYGHISEDASLGSLVLLKGSHSKVLTFEAFDADSGMNGELDFFINEQHGKKHFSIDSSTRTLSLTKEVEFERSNSINFTVGVRDHGKEQLEAENMAQVVILVTVPDPLFETKSFTLELREDTASGHVLFNGIQGRKQRLFYELIAFPEDRKHLSIDSDTGQVKLTHPLDYETKRDLKFVVSATNLVGAKDTASFLVHVLDANDCTPKWNKSVFSGHISEDAEVGSPVLNDSNNTLILEAYDEDSGRNGRLEYFINEPHGMEYFSVNSGTGMISLRKSLEYDKKSTVIFTVRVTDLGDVPLKGEPDALVVVSVERSTRPTTTTTSTTTSTLPPDPCLSNPCMNGGVCRRSNESLSMDFNCSCSLGFQGDFCQESSFICSEVRPCKNRGICQETDSYSSCSCQSGFQGDLCEEDVDECALSDTSICPPPATCINLPGSYRCICSPYLVNGSSHLCGASFSDRAIFPQIKIGSTYFNVSGDAIIGVICILFMLILTCCCLTVCWSFKGPSKTPPSRNRTPPQEYEGPEANEFLKQQQTHVNGLNHHQNGMTGVVSNLNRNHGHHGNEISLKRFNTASKAMSRASEVSDSSSNIHTLHLHPGRPLSLNNFDNIRVVGIVAEEGEIYSLAAVSGVGVASDSNTLTNNVTATAVVTGTPNACQDHREFQRELLHNLKKANPPIVTVTPQIIGNAICSSGASSHSGSKGKIQNGMYSLSSVKTSPVMLVPFLDSEGEGLRRRFEEKTRGKNSRKKFQEKITVENGIFMSFMSSSFFLCKFNWDVSSHVFFFTRSLHLHLEKHILFVSVY